MDKRQNVSKVWLPILMLVLSALMGWGTFVTLDTFEAKSQRALIWTELKRQVEVDAKQNNVLDGYMIDRIVEAIKRRK